MLGQEGASEKQGSARGTNHGRSRSVDSKRPSTKGGGGEGVTVPKNLAKGSETVTVSGSQGDTAGIAKPGSIPFPGTLAPTQGSDECEPWTRGGSAAVTSGLGTREAVENWPFLSA